MISVALGAAIALVGALAVIAIDWERIRARLDHRPRRTRHVAIQPSARDMLIAQGWPEDLVDVMANGPYDVTSTVYRNGSTKIWLRKDAA